MSPSKPARMLKVLVPKHNSDKLSAAAAAAVRERAAAEKKKFAGHGAKALVTNVAKAASSENASEWNSLVVHARAERGPQFDVGTQLFHVDQGSELYFDSTSLYTAEEFRHLGYPGSQPLPAHAGHPQSHPHPQHPQFRQSVPLPDGGGIQLRTPTRGRDQMDPFHHLSMQNQASPRTPQPFTLSSSGGPPSFPQQFQHQHQQHGQPGLPPGYPGTPVGYMGGRPGPVPGAPGGLGGPGGPGSTPGHGPGMPQMNGMMNGMPPQPGMMNGHAGSPSPARAGYPPGPGQGGMRNYPPGMYSS